VKKNKRTK